MSTVLKVSAIKEGAQAENMGIKVGDVIASYDGTELSSNLDLSNAALNAKNNEKEKVILVVIRNGKEITMEATTDKLGIDCIEDHSNNGQSNQRNGTENIKTEYGVAKVVSSVVSFIGWGLVIVGAFFMVLFPLAQGSQSRYGGISWFAILPGLGTAVSGFLLIMGAQVTNAAIDTADYTRELLKTMSRK